MRMTAAMIEIEKLNKSYGGKRGIVDVSLRVEPCDVFGFLGPNGAGKTTTIRILMALLQVWYSDENALVRDKLRQQTQVVLTPVVAAIIEQGRAEGTFTALSSGDTAQVILTLLYGAGETVGRLFFARQAREISLDDVRNRLAAYSFAIEQVLGIPAGSLQIVDDATLHEWFG